VHSRSALFLCVMIERRTFQLTEIRAEGEDGESLRISGHAAVFNKKSEPIFGMFREIVLPGAFKRSLKKDDIRALWNHDANFVLGRNKAGTLRLKEDDRGLKTDIDLPETQFARDLYQSIKRGDVDQMSFGFRTVTDKWRTEEKENVRELVEVDLFDVSPVTFPAYPQTDISARLNAVSDEIRSFYQQKITEIEKNQSDDVTVHHLPDEREQAEFLARMKERQDFIARRTPPPDPLSLSEILKGARR